MAIAPTLNMNTRVENVVFTRHLEKPTGQYLSLRDARWETYYITWDKVPELVEVDSSIEWETTFQTWLKGHGYRESGTTDASSTIYRRWVD